ncbi:porin family protein [Ekhidna sp.]|uniref:porin family protein n=1 Tax=Ekhidna sp. TaxID=2608089 RepID=UPI003C7E9339
MKRLLTFCILWMPLLIFAQGLSIKSSVSLSKWKGDGLDIAHENLTGFSVGMLYGIPISDNLIMNLGSRYTSNGTVQRFSESSNIMGISYHDQLIVKTKNLDFPILAEYWLNDRIYLMAGPYVSFLLSNEATFTYTQCIGEACIGEKEKYDLDDALESNSFGMEIGIGTLIFNGLLVEVNYLTGLSSLVDQEDPVKNQSFMFTLGYKF